MTEVRPGYISDGNGNWIQIGPSIPVGSTVYYQASEPATPQTGDIWIDSDNEVPSIDNSQFLRWRKTVSGGETSLSGLDDSGLSLQYTPAYEQVYLNGVLLVRGADYTATTGTSITGLTALAANDVVEVFGVVARVVGDVYTQAQADAKYATTVNFPAGAWTSYTPTITAQTGSITSYTINHARYIKLGKTVTIMLNFTITNNGTGSGLIIVSTPSGLAPLYPSSGSGRENASTGKMLQFFISGSSNILIINYDNSYAGGTNYNLMGTITYEVA